MSTLVEVGLDWIAVTFYALSTCLFVYGFVFKKQRALKWGLLLAIAGLIPHSAALLYRWYISGHGPWMRRYEVYTSLAWTGLLMFIVFQWRRPDFRPLGVVIMPGTVLLVGLAVFSFSQIQDVPESFKTYWLILHIYFAKLAYGTCLIGTALAVIYLMIQRTNGLGSWLRQRLPDPDRIDELSYRFTAFGFVMIGVMIAAGAIWAKNAWGSYWSWDPVETWSLISWILYGIYLHLRRMHGWKGTKAALFTIGAFSVLIFTLMGIGIVYVNNHSPYVN